MRERNQILEFWRTLADKGEPAVLATVVRTEGSSYRVPGARLLLSQNGQHVGGVSGGCLEDDILRRAWWLTAEGPVIRKYDTTADGEIATEGYGLGCNGVIHVLLERITSGQASILPVLEAVNRERRPALIAHILSPASAIGTRLVLDTEDRVLHNMPNADTAEHLLAQAREVTASTLIPRLPGAMEVYVERVAPPPHLLIFGAGDDAVPLAHLAKYLGWHVSILDGRAHYARPQKFMMADEVIVRQPGMAPPKIDPWTAAIVMTHSYSQDLDVLRTLAGQPLRYIGVLGPRRRSARLVDELDPVAKTRLGALHTPVGLDLGGDGPEQVALAAIAEIQSVLQGKTAEALSHRSGPIHNEGESTDEKNCSRSIICA